MIGPIIRISPNELHIYDPEFRRELYSLRGRWDRYDFAFKPFGVPRATFGIIDHYEHKERRSALNPFFSKQKVASLEPMFSTNIRKMIERIRMFVVTGEVVDLGVVFTALTMDIITEYAMGTNLGCLGQEDFNKNLVCFFSDFGPLWVVGKHLPFLPWLFRTLPSRIIKRLNVKIAAHKAFTEHCLSAVRQAISVAQESSSEKQQHQTIFHGLLTADGVPVTPKKEADLADEGEVILSGGAGTVSRPLQAIAYHLCTNPAILRQLRTELRSVQPLGSQIPVKLQDLEKLPYLTAVIKESIRITYGVVTRLARIAPDRVIQYGDWEIPAGTPVGMSNGLTFDDEFYFPDPHSFTPERWLDPEDNKRLDKIFAPFSTGTRMCIGIK